MRAALLLTFCAFILLPYLATAEIHTGTIQGDISQTMFCFEPSTSQALGTVSYDDVEMRLSYTYTYGDNAPTFDNGALFGGGSEITSHFHGPAPPGVHATIRRHLGSGNPKSASTILTEEEEAGLLVRSSSERRRRRDPIRLCRDRVERLAATGFQSRHERAKN